MNITEFINGLQEELEFTEEIKSNTYFQHMEEWDSMSAMVLIGYVSNNFGLSLTAPDLESLTTVQSLIEFIGTEKFID